MIQRLFTVYVLFLSIYAFTAAADLPFQAGVRPAYSQEDDTGAYYEEEAPDGQSQEEVLEVTGAQIVEIQNSERIEQEPIVETPKEELSAKEKTALVRRLLKDGKRSFAHKDYQAAIDVCNQALALEPANQTAERLIRDAGSALERQRQRADKEAATLRAKENRTAIAEYIKQAKSCYRKKDYQAAIDACDQALALEPANQTAERLIRDAELALERQRQQADKEAASLRARENRNAIAEHLELAKAHYRKKDYQAAVDEWTSALALKPDNRAIQRSIADARMRIDKQSGAWKQRIEKEKKALASFKEHMKKGKRLYVKKEYEQSLHEFEEAQKLRPEDASAQQCIEKAQGVLMKLEKKRTGRTPLRISEHMPAQPRVLALDECIDIAVENNIGLQVAKKQLRLAHIRLWEARRGLIGKISARHEIYGGKMGSGDPLDGGGLYRGRRYLLDVQQPIFRGGELIFIVKQAEANLAVVKNEYNRIKNEVVLKVKKAYYTLGKSAENLRIQEDLAKNVEIIDQRVEQMYAEGVCSKGENLNLKSQKAQVQFQIASAEQDIHTAELILQQAMSIDPKHRLSVEPLVEMALLELPELELFVELAMNERAEMKINHEMIRYYEYERKIMKARMFPEVELMGSYGQAGEEFITGTKYRLEAQWYGGFKVAMPFFGNSAEYSYTREHWPPVVSTTRGTESDTHTFKIGLLDSLKLYSDKQESEIEYTRAQQELERTMQDIMLEVQEGYYGCHKAAMQIEASKTKMAFQRQDLEFVKLRRGLNEIQDSAVVETMIRFSQEEFGYYQALSDYYSAVESLNKAIGIEDYLKLKEK